MTPRRVREPPLQAVVAEVIPGVVQVGIAKWQLPQHHRQVRAPGEAFDVRVMSTEVAGTPGCPGVALDHLVEPGVPVGHVVEHQVEVGSQ